MVFLVVRKTNMPKVHNRHYFYFFFIGVGMFEILGGGGLKNFKLARIRHKTLSWLGSD